MIFSIIIEQSYKILMVADTGYRLPDTLYRLLDTGYKLPDTGIQVTGYRLPDTGYKLPGTSTGNREHVTANSFCLKLIACGILGEKCFSKELIAERSVATKVQKRFRCR
jgi:hypothetical protein